MTTLKPIRLRRHHVIWSIGGTAVTLILLSPLFWRWHVFAEQGRAMAALEDQGAVVTECSKPGDLVDAVRALLRPRHVMVDVYGKHVDLSATKDLPGLTSLYVLNANLRQEDVLAISRMGQLTDFRMIDVQTPHALYDNWGGLDKLHRVELANVEVGDKGIAGIVRARNVTWLSLKNCSITDRGLAHLKALPGLCQLTIHGARLSAVGLRHLRDLPELSTLTLVDCGLTDESLEALRGCQALIELDVSDNPITDEGLKTLVEMKNLGWIKLNRTRITDTGLQAFASDPYNGRNLEVKGTVVTAGGIDKLREISPVMTVEDDHGEHSLETDENPRLPVPRFPPVAPP